MSKVAQIPNPSLAPLGMYDLKPVFDLDAKVDIPDCMYRWQFKTTWTKPIDVLIQDYQWSRAASILRILVGLAQVKWNILESTKNLGNIYIDDPGAGDSPTPCAIAALAARQDNIIARLEQLRDQVENLGEKGKTTREGAGIWCYAWCFVLKTVRAFPGNASPLYFRLMHIRNHLASLPHPLHHLRWCLS